MARGGGCPICHSPFREEIEERLKKKEPLRSISSWLSSEKGAKAAISSLSDHARSHIALPSAFVEKALSLPRTHVQAPSASSGELPSADALPPLEALALVQTKAISVLNGLSPQGEGLTPQEVSLWNGAARVAGAAAKARQELIFGKKINVSHQTPVKPGLKILSDEELHQRREQLLQERAAAKVRELPAADPGGLHVH